MSQHRKEEPRFSILMPCLDKAGYIDAALDSALSQMADGDELLVQDAHSTDGTSETVARRAANDPRIRHYIERDSGQTDALNRALKKATNEWIVWLNADDMLLPGALDAVRAALRGEDDGADIGLVIGDHLIVDDAGATIDDFPADPLDKRTLLRVGTAMFSGSTVIRKDILEEIGAFDERYYCAMDLDLQFRLAERNPGRIYIDKPLGALRMNDTTKLSNAAHIFVRECWELRRRYSHGADYLWAIYGEAIQLAAWATLRIRLTKRYRRIRRLVVRRPAPSLAVADNSTAA
ncbi:glycosyltransferase [Skermania sp. ID1734]|uniref:glycosyltransferase n=1 Tax=Skermania sp. ID1734 TaxID=2597516 RepID=UPI0011810108|nr:glycosyltransferase [Skermania sp. ID1734]TSD93181.1 glycosyltransferase [Skermania sp. ID1734]